MITKEELVRIVPSSARRADTFIDPLNAAMLEFDISNPMREAAFIAQIAHESGSFHYVRELASGAAYEGRLDLGNTELGDGETFRGRGLIQITGRANYAACGEALDLNLLDNPTLLEEPVNACRSAAWFWQKHGLNELADDGKFLLITKRINGGTNGYAERLAFYQLALKEMGLS